MAFDGPVDSHHIESLLCGYTPLGDNIVFGTDSVMVLRASDHMEFVEECRAKG